MNSKKLYFVLVSGLILTILITIAVAYGANILLSQQSKKLTAVKANTQALSNQLLELNKNKSDIATYYNLNKIAETVVPQDKDQSEAVREIVSLASQSGISRLSSITFPASTLGAGVLPASGALTPLPSTRASGGLTQVMPVKSIPGVYNLQITVSQDSSSRVSYSTFINFLSNLEQNRRTAQVTSINVQPDPLNPDQVAFTLVLDEFIKP